MNFAENNNPLFAKPLQNVSAVPQAGQEIQCNQPFAHRLSEFFQKYQALQQKDTHPFDTRLQEFFEGLKQAEFPAKEHVSETAQASYLVPETLQKWFAALEPLLEDVRRAAYACDPWEIAGVGSNEVRNSAILAWLLNPKGNHGFGHAALDGLLAMANQKFPGQFNGSPCQFCNVRAEVNPDGDRSNRVDIEVASNTFYLLIEVKIWATEGNEQLDRYGDLAEKKAANRPWALVYLTRQGRKSSTAIRHSGKVIPVAWSELARQMRKSLDAEFAQARHIQTPQRTMAQQMAKWFLQRIQSF